MTTESSRQELPESSFPHMDSFMGDREVQKPVNSAIESTLVLQWVNDLSKLALGSSTGYSVGSLPQPVSISLEKFIHEPAFCVLYVQKLRNGNSSLFRYVLSHELRSSTDLVATLALIKLVPSLLCDAHLSDQIQAVNIPHQFAIDGRNEYETLHNFVRLALSPYFEALAQDTSNNEQDAAERTAGTLHTKKKLAELELSIVQLRDNCQLNALVLEPHEYVVQALKEAAEDGRRPSIAGLRNPEVIENDQIMNAIQGTTVTWRSQIKSLTERNRDPASGTAMQEIQFWQDLDDVHTNLEQELRGDHVNLTFEFMAAAKRLSVSSAVMLQDTGLRTARDLVKSYSLLMRDFPLTDLLGATTLREAVEGIAQIFSHLSRRLRAVPYPIARAIPFVEAITGDIELKVLQLLRNRNLLVASHSEFEEIMRDVYDIFATYDEQVKDFITIGRDMLRKRNEKFLVMKVSARHARLQERIAYVSRFRTAHDQFYEALSDLVAVDESNLKTEAMELESAFSTMLEVDVLDLTTVGIQAWRNAEQLYSDRVARIESNVIDHLRERLEHSTSAKAMFKVFEDFEALMGRPRVRAAVQEYQKRLLAQVKEDIGDLQKVIRLGYSLSRDAHLHSLKSIPILSGQILWSQQLTYHITTYMQRIRSVLGEHWHTNADGQALHSECSSLLAKLDTRPLLENWILSSRKQQTDMQSAIMVISRRAGIDDHIHSLDVNFDSKITTLYRETDHLLYQGSSIQHQVIVAAKAYKHIHQYAVILNEALSLYHDVQVELIALGDAAVLLASYQETVHNLLATGLRLQWRHLQADSDSFKTAEQFIESFTEALELLALKIHGLHTIRSTLSQSLTSIKSCFYESLGFAGHIAVLQEQTNVLDSGKYSNVATWTDHVNSILSHTMCDRLDAEIKLWTRRFESASIYKTEALFAEITSSDGDRSMKRSSRDAAGLVDVDQHDLTLVRVLLKDQVVRIEPALEFVEAQWIASLSQLSVVVLDQPLLIPARTESAVANVSSVGSRLRASTRDLLVGAINTIYENLRALRSYTSRWKQSQALWNLQMSAVYDSVGSDLSKWLQLIDEIKDSRKLYDTKSSRCRIGAAIVEFSHLQTRVNHRYDVWQHEILSEFGKKVEHISNEVYGAMKTVRLGLELRSYDAFDTASVLKSLTALDACKEGLDKYSRPASSLQAAQQVLKRHRFEFPEKWLHSELILAEIDALQHLYEKRHAIFEQKRAAISHTINEELERTNREISRYIADWFKDKPLDGKLEAATAIERLETYKKHFGDLRLKLSTIHHAKSALGHHEVDHHDPLKECLEEVNDLHLAWNSVGTVFVSLQKVRDVPWTAYQGRVCRQDLEAMLDDLRRLPSNIRQYGLYEHANTRVQEFLKTNIVVARLKNDTIRERHLARLFQKLTPHKRFHFGSLSLGDLLSLDLASHGKLVSDVLTDAEGEARLEEFLREVKEFWTSFLLDLFAYKHRCDLIRGWDVFLQRCNDDLSTMSSMRHSSYFKQFQEESDNWTQKLTRIHLVFNQWLDVQRQWIYLEGIFQSSTDITHLLPIENARFRQIDSEFLALMRKVSRNPAILDVCNIVGAQHTIERLDDSLTKIQKALGQFLENERAHSPRFYFLGDEDLLELLGNNSDANAIQKHLRKLFPGIHSLELEPDTNCLKTFFSVDGEVLDVVAGHTLSPKTSIHDRMQTLQKACRSSLISQLADALSQLRSCLVNINVRGIQEYLQSFPAQILLLARQCQWSSQVEELLDSGVGLDFLIDEARAILTSTSVIVLDNLSTTLRRKVELYIAEVLAQRDILLRLKHEKAESRTAFSWLSILRFYVVYHNGAITDVIARMANCQMTYGFEYIVPTQLIVTPLVERCFLTLTQALGQALGGSPFGPAGTGKTESVKSLGQKLGKFVLVFCCDDTFDFQAISRILIGLCRIGAWGCFDEFNRLDAKNLSAISQQIHSIQFALQRSKDVKDSQLVLLGRPIDLDPTTGIFVTMNPGYAGRSELPHNLKKLFRNVAMNKPDKEIIAEVTFLTQGFNHAKVLAQSIIPFLQDCALQFSAQTHYDFGLRALKAILTTCGTLKRTHLSLATSKEAGIDSQSDGSAVELQVVANGIMESILPRLVEEDAVLLNTLIKKHMPGTCISPLASALSNDIIDNCVFTGLKSDDSWVQKVLQLDNVLALHHGVILVGCAGSGKTQAIKALAQAKTRKDRTEVKIYNIDAKVINKDTLYGTLDPASREWNDGLFTTMLRRIIDNMRGEEHEIHWIVFDCDIDPIWVENLNSVLDDNKILTLPTGDRLQLPSNVRLLFETTDLRHATLATVSRCGMVYFPDALLSTEVLLQSHLSALAERVKRVDTDRVENLIDLQVVVEVVRMYLFPLMSRTGVISQTIDLALKLAHVLTQSRTGLIDTIFAFVADDVLSMVNYNAMNRDFPLSQEQIQTYTSTRLPYDLFWACAGDVPSGKRQAIVEHLMQSWSQVVVSSDSLENHAITLPDSKVISWRAQIPSLELSTDAIDEPNLVIPTTDTMRHESILKSFLAQHRSLLLCGPPGSGKTMTLLNSLRQLPHIEVVSLNFSSTTSPELILHALEQHCQYQKTVEGIEIGPTDPSSWLVLFCDEINLPAPDAYSTQTALSLLRQLVERRGYWRPIDRVWISLQRIQIVGACNPSVDAGRHALPSRFLRHASVVLVDEPSSESLTQIYSVIIRSVLLRYSVLTMYSQPLTLAMVSYYMSVSRLLTSSLQAHYIYSARELSRWVKGISEALKATEAPQIESLIRIWAHEALRLFSDRLVHQHEKILVRDLLRSTITEFFHGVNVDLILAEPILYSSWLSNEYKAVTETEIRHYIQARMRTFCEEEVDASLVAFDSMLEHVLQIDRIFRQPQGHLILIGASGTGRTTLTRFAAWINGLKIVQLKIHRRYNAADFDDDLRRILRGCGTRSEKVCLILDEANMLETAFLERMNTLLANGEIPALFVADELQSLMTACREGASRDGMMLESHDELYKWFTQQVMRNLHVVLTMNPPRSMEEVASRSPALFNRCVVNWLGEWSVADYKEVANELLHRSRLHTDINEAMKLELTDDIQEDVLARIFANAHEIVIKETSLIDGQAFGVTLVSSRHYLNAIALFLRVFEEQQDRARYDKQHLSSGLEKLQETVLQIDVLQQELRSTNARLKEKDDEASQKLQQMVAQQQEAEQKKLISLEIQDSIAKQEKEITLRHVTVMEDLAKAEPAVLSAQEAVSNIKKQQLTEVRSMSNPPEAVKLALESVCTLLGHHADSWRMVQSIIRRDDFISSIVHFDNESQMSPALREHMKQEYLPKPNFQFEAVNRASKACGPLVQWVVAQVNFSEILDRVSPLRAEMQELEDAAVLARKRSVNIMEMIEEIEESIALYKVQYAELIRAGQMIRQEKESVEHKVSRSVRLLASLETEENRWQQKLQEIQKTEHYLVGDSLMSALVLAYTGVFEQGVRSRLKSMWQALLEAHGLLNSASSGIVDRLVSADERLTWQRADLPADLLSLENAAILKFHVRYPFIIDPSGKAVDFLIKKAQEGRLVATSFLDPAYAKHLESALRFGTQLIIKDAEQMDPAITNILNQEYTKLGGRTMVQVGQQSIDIAPTFQLFLVTKKAEYRPPPGVCSKVTLVNFSVTRASLESQTLHKVLLAQDPRLEASRAEAIATQGTLSQAVRKSEQELLNTLSSAQGSLLDNEDIIKTLQALKSDAESLSLQVQASAAVLDRLDNATESYLSVGRLAGVIYTVLELLAGLNHFYRFSLSYMEDLIDEALQHASKASLASSAEYLDIVNLKMLDLTHERTSQALLTDDRDVLALLLVLAFLQSLRSSDDQSDTWKHFLDLSLPTKDATLHTSIQTSDETQQSTYEEELSRIAKVGDESGPFEQDISSLAKLFSAHQSLEMALKFFDYFKYIQPAKLIDAIPEFTKAIVQISMTRSLSYNLSGVALQHRNHMLPIFLGSVPGTDASFQVELAAKQSNCDFLAVSMGSGESIKLAETALQTATQCGSWVLVKNAHLDIEWLTELEQKIEKSRPHPSFRLFLSAELTRSLPEDLLRRSRKLLFEGEPGIKANLQEPLKLLSSQEAERAPVERSRLLFLLSWFHAVIMDRLRYPTIGWSKHYDFTEADFLAARNVCNSWIDIVSETRSNIDPERIPWQAIQTLLSQAIYGGHIDNAADQALLEELVRKFLNPAAYNADYELVSSKTDALVLPDYRTMTQFKSWVAKLPEHHSATWLGLPADAEDIMLLNKAKYILTSTKTVGDRLMSIINT